MKKILVPMLATEWYKEGHNHRPGWVYFVSEELGGHVKIGKAKDIPKRVKAFKTEFPSKLTIEAGIYSLCRDCVESTLHEWFSVFRVKPNGRRTEWFDGCILKKVLSFPVAEKILWNKVAWEVGRGDPRPLRQIEMAILQVESRKSRELFLDVWEKVDKLLPA